MKIKDNRKVILPVLLVFTSAFVIFSAKESWSSLSTLNSDSDSNFLKSSDQIAIPTSFQQLSVITNRCRGCGKCARIDPSHFEMVNGLAQVISSTNLDSQKLSLAINNCPARAITLE